MQQDRGGGGGVDIDLKRLALGERRRRRKYAELYLDDRGELRPPHGERNHAPLIMLIVTELS